jgi:hypothetical protein
MGTAHETDSIPLTEYRYSEFRNILSSRFVPLPGADEIKSAELLNSEIFLSVNLPAEVEVDCRSLNNKEQRGNAHLRRGGSLQSRTGVGMNCKSAFPGARIQGGRRATGLSRLSFNIPSSSQRNAGKEPVRNPYSEYSGTRNMGK